MSAPLFQFNRHKDDIEREVIARSVDAFADYAGHDHTRSLQLVLNDAAFHEINRLEKVRGREAQRLEDWKNLARRIGRMTEDELKMSSSGGPIGMSKTSSAISIKGYTGSQHPYCQSVLVRYSTPRTSRRGSHKFGTSRLASEWKGMWLQFENCRSTAHW